MPIRPSERARYPRDWSAVSVRIRARAGGRCECGGECGGGHEGRCSATDGAPHPVTGSRVVLTVAHLNHEPEDCRDANLRAMCQRCHNRLDQPHRQANARATRRARRASGDLFEGGHHAAV